MSLNPVKKNNNQNRILIWWWEETESRRQERYCRPEFCWGAGVLGRRPCRKTTQPMAEDLESTTPKHLPSAFLWLSEKKTKPKHRFLFFLPKSSKRETLKVMKRLCYVQNSWKDIHWEVRRPNVSANSPMNSIRETDKSGDLTCSTVTGINNTVSHTLWESTL